MSVKYILLVAIGITCMPACNKTSDNSNTPPPGNQADATLVAIGTNIIVPAYQQLSNTTAALDAAVGAFNGSSTPANLQSLRTAFQNAYLSWAACSEFEFGPAADLFLTTHFTNAFPTDTVTIKNNIAGALYAIDGLGNFAAQGFPAIDYLLYSGGDDAVMARMTPAAKNYLGVLSNSLKVKSSAVASAWTQPYLETFVNAKGVDAGSSLSLLVNAYVQDFDVNLQNFKVGIPIGLYGPSVLPKSPQKVEAYFSGLSNQLLVAQVKAYQHIYADGIIQKVSSPLKEQITSQLATLLTKIEALPAPFSTAILNNSPAIGDAYPEIRKTTVLLKVDLASALGIKISFQDDDGD